MKKDLFAKLIDESLPMLRGTAYRILGNADDADDAVQEALLLAWKKFDSFQSRAKISTWVCRITVNVAYDMLRKRQREEKKLRNIIPDESCDPFETQRIDVLKKAVSELPEKLRDALSFTFFSGLSGEEAAKLQNCNVNTLYGRVARAKELLYEKLKGF